MKINLLFLLSAFFAFSLTLKSNAQEFCGTDIIHQKLMQTDSAYRNNYLKCEASIVSILQKKYYYSHSEAKKSIESVIMIPTVVHVIHLGEPVGDGSNISDAAIQNTIDGVNNRWRGITGTGVDVEVQFCLAPIDSSGNPSTGIVRVDGSGIPNYQVHGVYLDSTGYYNATMLKDLSHWPTTDYLNIWVVHKITSPNAAAYSTSYTGGPYDGITIRAIYMTSSYTILTHELGHALSLRHTFETSFGSSYSDCPPDSNCLVNGDGVCDTKPHRKNDCSSTNPCPGSGTVDNSRYNYMSYCSNKTRFTQGQKERIHAALQVFPRIGLVNNNICLGSAVPEFSADNLISIFPNPVTSVLSVNGIHGKSEVAIYDLTGKVLLSKTVKENSSFDLSSLEKGVYIFKSGTVTRKIVKI